MAIRPFLLLTILFISGCGPDTPTGVSKADIEGLWTGRFSDVTLMGRQLNGEIDWQFNTDTFEIQFVNPGEGETQQIGGDWKFAGGRLVLTLKTSFPISNDLGSTDSLFVSILNDELSVQPLAGGSILLQKTTGFLKQD